MGRPIVLLLILSCVIFCMLRRS